MEKIEKIIHSKKFKHTFVIAFIAVMLGWAGFRFAMIASENARQVYNIARVSATNGIPVETVVMSVQTGILYEPLAIKNNRAYVSGARAEKLSAGQKISNGKIKSVSRGIDLNTGMYTVRTTGVADGLHFAEFTTDGYFVPLYAVSNNRVYVAENGVATVRDVVVARQDSENAYITSGLNDGDIVILSSVSAGDKVQQQN
jgi:hypothetical protein